jgi:hypothetical protein
MLRTLYALLIASCLLAGTARAGDPYVIIHVKGTILRASTRTPIQVGDRLDGEERLIFKGSDAVAAAMAPGKGRFVIKPQAGSSSSELGLVLRESLSPGTGQLSTRSGSGHQVILRNSFGVQEHFEVPAYLVLGSAEVEIDSEEYPLNSQYYFYVKYQYGEAAHTHKVKLPAEGKLVRFSQEILFGQIDSLNLSEVKDPKLYYMRYNRAESICSFHPVFVDEEVVTQEVKAIVQGMKEVNASEGEIRNMVLNHLNELYGRPNVDNVNAWLDKQVFAE